MNTRQLLLDEAELRLVCCFRGGNKGDVRPCKNSPGAASPCARRPSRAAGMARVVGEEGEAWRNGCARSIGCISLAIPSFGVS